MQTFYICLSVCLSVCQSLCLRVSLSVCLRVSVCFEGLVTMVIVRS